MTEKDIKIDGNIVRFINVRKGEEGESTIVIESKKIRGENN